MAMVGGSIKRLELAGRNFSVAADADVRLKLGGTKVTAVRNGDGSTRYVGEEEDWALLGVTVAIDASANAEAPQLPTGRGWASRDVSIDTSNKNALYFLQDIVREMDPVPCAIELIDGTIFHGSGLVVGDREYSTAKATMTLDIMGSGELTKQQ
jgi:hypothetical protein